MTDLIEIHIDHSDRASLVGRLRYFAKARSQTSIFEYADEWLASDGAFAIDPANLPLDRNPTYASSDKSALPGAIRDTSPDRWGQLLIRRALRKTGRSRTLSEVDYLLAINDQTRIGALRYKREGDADFSHDIGRYRVPPLVHLPALLNAADAVHSNTETANDLKLLLGEGSPLGGARPKSAVVDKDGLLAIAKFPKPADNRSIPHGEILALSLAKHAGLNVADGRLLTVADRPVALIRRFDRAGNRRIPFLSAMSLLGLNDGDIATYTDIAEIIRFHSSTPTADLHELWRRIVFGVMIGNLDDHLRNHGFLHGGEGKWRLSPAFDLNPVPIEEKVRELTTWISEEGPEASLDLARHAAPSFALKASQAEQIVREVSEATANWREVARQLGMKSSDMDAYGSAFNHV